MAALLRSSLVLVAVLAVGGGVASAEEWKPYSSQDGRYSIEFPGTPQQAKQSLQTKFGPVTARLAMLQVSNGVFYAVQFQDYPKAVLEKHSSDDLLDGARESALKGLKGGRLAGEEKISLAGHPGRQFVVDGPGNLRLTMRVYLVMNRLYSVISSVKGNDKDADPKRFFESFKLVG